MSSNAAYLREITFWVWRMDHNKEHLFGEYTWDDMVREFKLTQWMIARIRQRAFLVYHDFFSHALEPTTCRIRILPAMSFDKIRRENVQIIYSPFNRPYDGGAKGMAKIPKLSPHSHGI